MTNAKSRGTGATISIVAAKEAMSSSFSSPSSFLPGLPWCFIFSILAWWTWYFIFFRASFFRCWWLAKIARCFAQFVAESSSTRTACSCSVAFMRRLRPRTTNGCGSGNANHCEGHKKNGRHCQHCPSEIVNIRNCQHIRPRKVNIMRVTRRMVDIVNIVIRNCQHIRPRKVIDVQKILSNNIVKHE